MHVQFSGRYRLQVFHGDTDILLKDTGWFDNLITNNGLNLLATGIGVVVFVGSGATTPQFTDTAMETLLGSSNSMTSNTYATQTTTQPYYGWQKFSFAFGIGAIVGTIREVGFGIASNNLFSRALLTDVNGSGTTLTLGGIDRLVLTYELRQYIDTTDHTYTIDINGVSRSSLTRPGNIAGGGWARGGSIGSQWTIMSAYHNGTTPYVGAITGYPSGTGDVLDGGVYAYTPGTYVRDWYGVYGAGADRNYTAIYRTASGFNDAALLGGEWQFSLEPAVVKTQYQSFRIEGRYSWARYP